MSAQSFQPRYVAYATAHGRDPEAMLDHDDERFPGGCMAGFIVWVGAQLRDFRSHRPDCFANGNLWDQKAFDAFLEGQK